MKHSEFKKLVEEALVDLPEQIQKMIDNTVIVVEKKASCANWKSLLGLYQGVPQTTWGRNFGMRLPDKITIFQMPIENLVFSRHGKTAPDKIKSLVKIVVWHEIAHHFGFDEKQIRRLEANWKRV